MHGSALYGHLRQAHMHRLLFNKTLLLYCLTIFINDSTGQKNQLQLVRLESIDDRICLDSLTIISTKKIFQQFETDNDLNHQLLEQPL